jgi:hypothetical protein
LPVACCASNALEPALGRFMAFRMLPTVEKRVAGKR